MSESWIKMRTNLLNDPEVVMISVETELDPIDVVGRLWFLWSWADAHANDDKDGMMKGSMSIVDKAVRCNGFGAAMESVGWIAFHDGMMSFPGYIEHNGSTAKSRAQAQKRMRNKRNSDASVTPPLRSRCASVTQEQNDSVTRGEEIRLEEIRGEKKREDKIQDHTQQLAPAGLQDLIEAWNKVEGLIQCRKATPSRIKAYATRSKSADWLEDLPKAIEHLPKCRFLKGESESGWKADIDFFLRPDTVTKILEGKYDHGMQTKQKPTSVARVNERASLWASLSDSTCQGPDAVTNAGSRPGSEGGGS